MKTPALAAMLGNIQALFESETGLPLAPALRNQIESVLGDAIKGAVGLKREESFRPHEVTVMLTDLRGFTAISEQHSASVLLEMLNGYLIRMTEIAVEHGGTIDKFMGDAVMVLFGAPFSHGDDPFRAVHCAVDMQRALHAMNAENRERGLPELNMGIGINTGTVMAGLLGSDLYAEYTVIGDEVNLASRIEAYSLRGQVLISESTRQHVHDRVTLSDPMDVIVKGKKQPVNLFEVLGIPGAGKEVPRQEVRKSPRVETSMPFEYQRIDGKIVRPERLQGTILDLSYNGVLAQVEQPLPAQGDLRLDLHFTLSGTAATDVYGRVVRAFERDGRHLACIEFTSVNVQGATNIRRFVQLLIQGGVTK